MPEAVSAPAASWLTFSQACCTQTLCPCSLSSQSSFWEAFFSSLLPPHLSNSQGQPRYLTEGPWPARSEASSPCGLGGQAQLENISSSLGFYLIPLAQISCKVLPRSPPPLQSSQDSVTPLLRDLLWLSSTAPPHWEAVFWPCSVSHTLSAPCTTGIYFLWLSMLGS